MKHFNKNISILREIHNKLKKEEQLSKEEIDIYADYLYSSRDFSKDKGKLFVEYILNNADKYNIKSSPTIIGAISSYLPQEYSLDDEIKNVRFFIANKDGSIPTRIAHSSRMYKYCVFQKDYIENTSLNSADSILKSRTLKNNDIYWLIFVCFHELTHQYQKNELASGNFSSANISRAINEILTKYMPKVQYKSGTTTRMLTDYKINHDSDEIEIQADEEGWRQLRRFIKVHLKQELLYRQIDGKKVSLWMTADNNASNVASRRTFTMKKTALEALKKTGEGKIQYYAYYDLTHLERIMKEHTQKKEIIIY